MTKVRNENFGLFTKESATFSNLRKGGVFLTINKYLGHLWIQKTIREGGNRVIKIEHTQLKKYHNKTLKALNHKL